MITLLPTDTLTDVADKLDEAAEEARRDAIDKAKTNMQRLIAAGVIVTCDDEYEAAMIYAGREERAKASGRTVQEQTELEVAHKRRHAARTYCASIVAAGEAPHEYAERRAGILARVEGTRNGRRCNHRTTRKHEGWVHVDAVETDYPWTDEHGVQRSAKAHPDGMLCYRCGAFIADTDLALQGGPTAAARAAAAILEAAGPALFKVTIGEHRQGPVGERTVRAFTADAAKRAVVDPNDHSVWAVAYPAPFDATDDAV